MQIKRQLRPANALIYVSPGGLQWFVHKCAPTDIVAVSPQTAEASGERIQAN